MRKILLFCLILQGLLFLGVSGTCGTDITIFADFKAKVQASGLPAALKTKLLSIENAEASPKSDEKLGVCKDAVGTVTNTCCTQDFLQASNQYIKLVVKKILDKRPPAFNMLQGLEKAEREQKCGIFTPQNMKAAFDALKPKIEAKKGVKDASTVRFLQQNSPPGQGGQKQPRPAGSKPPCQTLKFKCSDGSVLTAREDCSFAKCPAFNSAAAYCPDDVRICSATESKTRTGENCAFEECSAESKALQEKKDKIEDGPLKNFRQMMLQCQLKAGIQFRRFFQGQICSFCTDPAQAATYFAADTLKVTQTSFDEFAQGVAEGLTCMNEVINQIKTFVQEKVSETKNQQCKNILNKFLTKISENGNKPCQDDSVSGCTGQVKTATTTTFDEGITTRLDDPPQDINLSTRILETENEVEQILHNNRILSATSITPGSTGASVQVVNSDEESALSAGGIMLSDEYTETSKAANIKPFAITIIFFACYFATLI